MSFLKVINIKKQFDHKQGPVLNDVDLTVKKGEVLGVLGKSGSGKTTLLRLIAGLEHPDSGEIQLDGKMLVNGSTFVPPEKRNIGMVFQSYALFPHMTVYKNVAHGVFKLSRKEKQSRIDQYLVLVNLQSFQNRYPHELSGGEQQRVALARTLVTEPQLLLLDEPFSNLDTELIAEIRDTLKTLLSQIGITTLLVTHNQANVENLLSQSITLQNGRITGDAK